MTEELIIDWEGRLLTKAEIAKLKQTERGRKQLYQYIFGARAGYAAQEVLNYLENELKVFSRTLRDEEMQNVASILYYCMYEAGGHKVEEWIRETVRYMSKTGHHPIRLKGYWDC